jgi:hypothetical protein
MPSITTPATPSLRLLSGLDHVEWDALAEEARRAAARERAMANHPAGRLRAGGQRATAPGAPNLRVATTS